MNILYLNLCLKSSSARVLQCPCYLVLGWMNTSHIYFHTLISHLLISFTLCSLLKYYSVTQAFYGSKCIVYVSTQLLKFFLLIFFFSRFCNREIVHSVWMQIVDENKEGCWTYFERWLSMFLHFEKWEFDQIDIRVKMKCIEHLSRMTWWIRFWVGLTCNLKVWLCSISTSF